MKKFLFSLVAVLGLCNQSQATAIDFANLLDTAGWYYIPFGSYYDSGLDMYITVNGWYDGWSSDYIYEFQDDNGDPFEWSFGGGMDGYGVPYSVATAMLPGMTSPAYVAPTETYTEAIDGYAPTDSNGDAVSGPIGTDPNAPMGPGFTTVFDLNDPDIVIVKSEALTCYAWDATGYIIDADGSMYIVVVNTEGNNNHVVFCWGPITPIIYLP